MSEISMLILLAGATGNLGSRIGEALVARGANVTALVRRGTTAEKVRAVAEFGATVALVDTSDRVEVAKACEGAGCMVSAVQGLHDVVVDAQAVLLQAAVAAGVPRFIPSDFSTDFRKLPAGENRNFDLRREFHEKLDAAHIASTAIFNGSFAEILTYNTPLFDMKNKSVGYWGDPDRKLDFTTMDDTAAFTAAAAIDPMTPLALHIASFQVSPRELATFANDDLKTAFELVRLGSVDDLRAFNHRERAAHPEGERELYPAWQQSQYMQSMLSAHHESLDNARYPNMTWTSLQNVLGKASRSTMKESHMTDTILLAGATGMLGSRIAAHLLDNGAHVRLLVRNSSDATRREALAPLLARGAELVEGDLAEAASLDRATQGVDVIVSAVQGGPDVIIDGQVALAEAGKRSGVRRILPSDYALDLFKATPGEHMMFDLRAKADARIAEIGLEQVNILQRAFMDMFMPGKGAIDLDKGTIGFFGDGNRPIELTSVEDTARMIARVALDRSVPAGKFAFAGDRISFREAGEIIAARTGHPITPVSFGSEVDLRAAMAAADPQKRVMLAYLLYMTNGQTALTDLRNDRYPDLKLESFEAFAAAHLPAHALR